jgi:beta-lactamase regulating signal transducer with metallopeptidase domain
MNAMWPALVNGAIVSLLPAAAVWMALRLMPRSLLNAAARYLIWWITLAVVIAMPLLYLATPPTHLSPAPSWPPASVVLLDRGDGSQPVPESIAPRHSVTVSTSDLPRWLPALWMLASGLLLTRLMVSYSALQRKSARSAEVTSAWQARVQEWLSRLGGERASVRLATSLEISIPVAAGPSRPSILVPHTLFQQLADEDMDQIGLHETAHLARRDDWGLMAQRTIEAIFALHPVVRFVSRQIDLEREIACDDRVVEATGRPVAYAACLARLAELCGSAVAPAAAARATGNRSHLTHRVELLVDRTRDTAAEAGAPRVMTFAVALLALACLVARVPLPISLETAPAVEATVAAAVPEGAPGQLTQPPQSGKGIMTVLYFDLTGMSKDAQVQALDGAKKYIRNNVFPQKMAALIIYDGKSAAVRQDFTADVSLLNRAIDQVSAVAADIENVKDGARVAALQSAVEKLKPLSGQKDFLFFVCLPLVMDQVQLDKTFDMALKANVEFHPIDYRGVIQHGFRF